MDSIEDLDRFCCLMRLCLNMNPDRKEEECPVNTDLHALHDLLLNLNINVGQEEPPKKDSLNMKSGTSTIIPRVPRKFSRKKRLHLYSESNKTTSEMVFIGKRKKLNEGQLYDDETCKEISNKRRNNYKTLVIAGPNPPPDLSEAHRAAIRELGGTQVSLILQKKLYDGDLIALQSHLPVPLNQLGTYDFMEEDTRKYYQGLDMMVIEPGLVRTLMPLRHSDNNINSCSSNMLGRNWSYVAVKNWLAVGAIIQAWFFRDNNGRPCFALVDLGRQHL